MKRIKFNLRVDGVNNLHLYGRFCMDNALAPSSAQRRQGRRRMAMGEMSGEEREEWRRGKMKKIDLRIAL